MSITSLIQQGGVVMIPLLVGSILALAVVIDRAVTYLRIEPGSEAFRTRLLELLRGRQYDEAKTWLASGRGPIPAVMLAGVEARHLSKDALEATMAAVARREVGSLRRGLSILDTVITAAPLVGLLGTITGMMGTFRMVAARLAHNPSADTTGITAGIGEALTATATGILIAVICVVFNNLYQSFVDTRADAVEALGAETIAALAADRV